VCHKVGKGSEANVHDPSANTPIDGRNRAKYLGLSVLVGASVLFWLGPLASTMKLALVNDAYTYVLLVLPLSAALAYVKAKRMPTATTSGPWVGVILLGVAFLLRGLTAWSLGHFSPYLSLSMFALVLWWIGSVIVCFGLAAFQSLLFPLCFLFLVVPLPDRAVNVVTGFLQQQSAVTAEILFSVARIPVSRDGVLLSIPGLDIEVAHECSSIRSSTMLIVITLVLAHLFLRSWWRQTLLLVIAIPLSVAKNALRIFMISELGTRVDPGYLTGNLHRNGGIVFLSLSLIVVILMVWMLRKGEFRTASAGFRT
jgi:exosortase